MVGTEPLALYALALVVAFGIGFMIWTFFHLVREANPSPGQMAQAANAGRLRR